MNVGHSELLVRDRCPVCGEPAKNSHREVHSVPPAEDLSVSELGPFLQGYDSRRSFFSYHECPKCGVLYCPTYLNQSQLDSLYRQQPENIADAPLAAREQTQKAYFDLLSKYSSLDRHYVEIGCDIGLFAKHIAKNGRFERLHLYEPNLNVHDTLRTQVRNVPFDIRVESFEPSQLSDGSASTVVAIHVLDHVLHPQKLLSGLHKAMARDGILMAVVHNRKSLLARVLGTRWSPYTLQHPQLYSPESLRSLLEVAGFDVLKIQPVTNTFPLPFLVRAGFSALGVNLPKFLDASWPLVTLRLGNIAVVGRKR